MLSKEPLEKSNFMLSVCVLTFNSQRTLERCLSPLSRVADELIVVDSGSTDGTLDYLKAQGWPPAYRSYDTHAKQMNFAISLARHDWVLCIDSDEFLDKITINNILNLKEHLGDPKTAYRIERHWHVLGQEVRSIYPISSPDYPVRLFNRKFVRFNDQPVDDKAVGFEKTMKVKGHVIHDTFFNIHEVFHKLNTYTTRINQHKNVRPSLVSAVFNPFPALFKWYIRKGGFRDGRVGIVTGAYAALYTFLKYFKSWYLNAGQQK
jgi:glycosyltransferase involved in cell wall biosynthesis